MAGCKSTLGRVAAWKIGRIRPMTTANTEQNLAEAQTTAQRARQEFDKRQQAVLNRIAETIPEAAERRLKTIVVEEGFTFTRALGREKVAALRSQVGRTASELANYLRDDSYPVNWPHYPCYPYSDDGTADRSPLITSIKQALLEHASPFFRQFHSILDQYGYTTASFHWEDALISPDDLWETADLEPLVPALESLASARAAEEQARIAHDRYVAEGLWGD